MKFQHCPPQLDVAFTVAKMYRGEMDRGNQPASLLLYLHSNTHLRPLWGPPLHTNLGTAHKVHSLLKDKSVFEVPILKFADNVLHKFTPGVKGGELWEATRWQNSMALFLCLECQLPKNHRCTLILCICTGF